MDLENLIVSKDLGLRGCPYVENSILSKDLRLGG